MPPSCPSNSIEATRRHANRQKMCHHILVAVAVEETSPNADMNYHRPSLLK
jgi:hypothetical protein